MQEMNPGKSDDYITQWRARLAREKAERRDGKISVVLFRLERNWFALTTQTFREIVEPRTIRRIPHRTNPILLGMVNVRGTLHLCVDLAALFKLAPQETPDQPMQNLRAFRRMGVIEKEGNAWAFHIDQIHSLYRVSASDLIPFSDPEKVTRGIIEWQGKTVDFLDENLLFEKLLRSLE
jgi:chemotaxis-related protein WspD